MGRTVRTLVALTALAVVYACVPTLPDEGGDGASSSSGGSSSGGVSSSGTSGTSEEDASIEASTSADGATSSDGSVVVEGGSADAADDAAVDAAPDVTVDAGSDGGTCPIFCTTGDFFPNGKPVPPTGGNSSLCKGGCTWYGGKPSTEYRNVCHMTCRGVCAPDPPYGGVCPAECTGGCADGVCNITCDGADPALSCQQSISGGSGQSHLITKPIVRCPDGIPCKVTCRNNGCASNIIACPRDEVSCEIDCGFSPDGGCAGSQLYCGAGRCNVHGSTPGAGVPRNVGYPEYNLAADVCGESCSCSLPYPVVFEGAHVRCQCKDGTLFNYGNGGGQYGAAVCRARCAAYGGWSAPWDRKPYSW